MENFDFKKFLSSSKDVVIYILKKLSPIPVWVWNLIKKAWNAGSQIKVGMSIVGYLGVFHVSKFLRSCFFPDTKRKNPKRKVKPADDGRVPESTRDGSVETKMPHRKGEAFIFIVDEDSEFVNGKGCRVHDWLVLPEHVIAPAQGLLSIGVANPADPSKFARLSDTHETIPVATDVIAIRLSNDMWSKIGITSVSIGVVNRANTVTVTGIKGLGTLSNLRPARSVGELIYEGTTAPGYSGALYMYSNMALGIHLSGGSQNRGIALGMVLAVLNKLSNIKPEATEDFFRKMANATDSADILVERWGQDDCKIFYRGKYHVTDIETLETSFGDRFDSVFYREALQQDFRHRPISGALSKLPSTPKPKPSLTAAKLTHEFNSLLAGTQELKQHKKKIRALFSEALEESLTSN